MVNVALIHPITNKFTNTSIPSHFQDIPTPPAMTLSTYTHAQSLSLTCTPPLCLYLIRHHHTLHLLDSLPLHLSVLLSLLLAVLECEAKNSSPESSLNSPWGTSAHLEGRCASTSLPHAHTIGVINGTEVLYKRFVNETLGDGGGGACIHTITALHVAHWNPLKQHDGVSVRLFYLDMIICPQCKKEPQPLQSFSTENKNSV